MESIYKRVGEYFLKVRVKRGLSQAHVARSLKRKLSRSGYSNIEIGNTRVLLHSFCDICEVLNVRPEIAIGFLKDSASSARSVGARKKAHT